MTQPLTQNISITRGDDYSATITFDQATSGFAEMRFTVREDWATSESDNTDALISVTLSTSGTYTGTLALTSSQTVDLVSRMYVYDVAVTTLGGSKYTTQRGHLRVGPDVSR
jgi:hypothetical protein